MRGYLIPLGIVAAVLTLAGGYFASSYLRSSQATNLVALGGTDVRIDPTDRIKPVHHNFRLHNPTSESVRVLKIESSCSCTTGELDETVVEPGETIALPVRIQSFTAYAPSYNHTVTVITTRGEIVLRLFGKLPKYTKPFFRPSVLYLDPLPEDTIINRVVNIRVPIDCCTDLREEDIRRTGAEGLQVKLSEDPSTAMFREFTLSVSISVDKLGDADGRLELNTGCGLIAVVIKTAGG